ncbi:MAG TPA: hypothetical protein VNU26_04470 [Mycobacteriales bacterium]|nr:hypothetical protein [Mycobacteriales bacterium]
MTSTPAEQKPRLRRAAESVAVAVLTLVTTYAVFVGAVYAMPGGFGLLAAGLVAAGAAVIAAGLLAPRSRRLAVVVGVTGVATGLLSVALLALITIPADF